MTTPTDRRSRTAGRCSLLGLLLGLCVLAACGHSQSTDRPPNVLLITLDTTRFDVLGSYGRELAAETPHLDRIAGEGVRFERAYCQVPSTLPSHASILTGLTPLSHGVHDNAVYRLGPEVTTLAESLGDAGYRTGAFVSAFVLDRRFGLDQGFQTYDDAMEEPLRSGSPPEMPDDVDPQMRGLVSSFYEPYQRRADRVTPRALEWLGAHDDDAEPFFLWVHYFDAHEPYTPPDEWVERYDPGYDGAMSGQVGDFFAAARGGQPDPRDLAHMRARYRGEVSFVDEWVGRLLAGVEQRGLLDRTLTVVVADHGESLGEHGMFFVHNLALYDDTVRVPLLMRFPDGDFSGKTVDSLVSTVDIVPTTLAYLGLDADDPDGRSLIPLLEGSASEPGDAYIQTLCERQVVPVPIERRGLLSGAWKLLRTTERGSDRSKVELYDLNDDPTESHDRAGSEPERTADLAARLDELLRGATPRADAAIEELDEETLEKLRSLGYVE